MTTSTLLALVVWAAISGAATSGTSHWTSHESPEGTQYYHNAETGESVWSLPPGAVLAPPPQVDSAEAADAWVEYRTPEDGKVFYHNTVTGVSSWTLAPGAVAAQAPPNDLRNQVTIDPNLKKELMRILNELEDRDEMKWRRGREEAVAELNHLLTESQAYEGLTPHAACLTPHAARHTPHAARRTPHAARRTPHAARETGVSGRNRFQVCDRQQRPDVCQVRRRVRVSALTRGKQKQAQEVRMYGDVLL